MPHLPRAKPHIYFFVAVVSASVIYMACSCVHLLLVSPTRYVLDSPLLLITCQCPPSIPGHKVLFPWGIGEHSSHAPSNCWYTFWSPCSNKAPANLPIDTLRTVSPVAMCVKVIYRDNWLPSFSAPPLRFLPLFAMELLCFVLLSAERSA